MSLLLGSAEYGKLWAWKFPKGLCMNELVKLLAKVIANQATRQQSPSDAAAAKNDPYEKEKCQHEQQYGHSQFRFKGNPEVS